MPIYLIRHNGGIVAGDPLTIDLWGPGCIVTITDAGEVSIIQRAIREAKRIGADVNRYVSFVLSEEGIL